MLELYVQTTADVSKDVVGDSTFVTSPACPLLVINDGVGQICTNEAPAWLPLPNDSRAILPVKTEAKPWSGIEFLNWFTSND